MTNLYETPQSNVEPLEELQSGPELARRGTRLAAAIIDGVIGMIYGFAILYFTGFWSIVSNGEQPSFLFSVGMIIFSFIGFVLIHGYFLYHYGQTIGKKALDIKIVGLDNQKPQLSDLLLKRYLPISLVGIIPMIGSFLPLVDVLFIYRKDRRCVHDLIAGTKVVDA